MRTTWVRTSIVLSLLPAGTTFALPLAPEAPVAAPSAAPIATSTEAPPVGAASPEAPTEALPPSLLAISGHVAATYNYNVMDPVGGVTPYHSYTAPHNTFLLNQAHLAITGADARFAYAVELDAGTDAILNSVGIGSYVDVAEAYVTYAGAAGLGFKAGKFATFNGIEVIESPANPTISRGFLFGLAEPATHVGGLATYKISDQLDVALGLVNGWDLVVDNNRNKTIVGKLGVTHDRFGLVISTFAGKERNNTDWRATVDATAVIKLTDLDLWLQANVGFEEGVAAGGENGTWMGVGLQPVKKFGDALSVGARIEVFVDGDGARSGVAQTLLNVSVAPAYKVHDHVTVRAEGRVDVSSEDVFQGADGDAPGAIQLIALTEAIVTF